MIVDPAVEELVARAREAAREVLAPAAERIDAEALWPVDNLRAIGDAGLLGLHVPSRLGGHGLGLVALAEIAEELAVGCSSTAMCYGMHCVGAAVIAAKATPDQEERYLKPIAEGRHISSLSLSEPGTGAHFYLPRSTFEAEDGGFRLNGEKSFITSGGYADSYVMSAVAPGEELDPGTFTCLLVDGDAPGLEWGPTWDGFGMRGNSSRGVVLNNVPVPRGNLLGAEGDQLWYVFEVVAPYFLVAMAGVYLGVARAALEGVVGHVQSRTHAHTGQRLSDHAVLIDEVGQLWTTLERSRQLLRHAARLGDARDPAASQALFAAKIDVAEAVLHVTNGAMTLSGGRGYQSTGALGRLVRDAHAAHVMAPTTHLLKGWLGRSVLGLSIF